MDTYQRKYRTLLSKYLETPNKEKLNDAISFAKNVEEGALPKLMRAHLDFFGKEAFTHEERKFAKKFFREVIEAIRLERNLSNKFLLTKIHEGLFYSFSSDTIRFTSTKKKIEALLEWSQQLTSVRNKEKLLQFMLEGMTKVLAFKRGSLVVKKDNFFELKDTRGEVTSSEVVDQFSLNGRDFSVEVTSPEQGVFTHKVSDNRHYPTSSLKKSKLIVPIKQEGQVLGVLKVESKKKKPFTKNDQLLLELLASYVAFAIQTLEEETKRKKPVKIDELWDNYLVMTIHELGNVTQSLKNLISMVKKGYYGGLTIQQKGGITNALEEVNHLARLMQDLRHITDLKRGAISLEQKKHRLVDTIEKTLAQYQDIFLEEGIKIIKDLQKPLVVTYDEARIMQVLQNLVKNAINFTKDTIKIRGVQKPSQVQVSVQDNGEGIQSEEQQKIFDLFYPNKETKQKRREFRSMGIGLTICKLILQAHDGDLWVNSSPGEGTTFTFSLPSEKSVIEGTKK